MLKEVLQAEGKYQLQNKICSEVLGFSFLLMLIFIFEFSGLEPQHCYLNNWSYTEYTFSPKVFTHCFFWHDYRYQCIVLGIKKKYEEWFTILVLNIPAKITPDWRCLENITSEKYVSCHPKYGFVASWHSMFPPMIKSDL